MRSALGPSTGTDTGAKECDTTSRWQKTANQPSVVLGKHGTQLSWCDNIKHCPRARSEKGPSSHSRQEQKSHAGDTDAHELQAHCHIAIKIHLKSTSFEGVRAKEAIAAMPRSRAFPINKKLGVCSRSIVIGCWWKGACWRFSTLSHWNPAAKLTDRA